MGTSEITYHSYQQILDLEGGGSNLKQRRIRRKFTKSRDGCMNCKRRRKKCDEVKPICTGCSRNKLECSWPGHVNSETSIPEEATKTAVESKLMKTDIRETIQSQSRTLTPSYNFDNLFGEISSKEMTIDDFDTGLLLDQFLNIQTENSYQYKSNTSYSSPDETFSSKESSTPDETPNLGITIPGVVMTHRESICYGTFLNKFITSISPPHCPPIVSPTNVMLPFSVTHTMVRETFLACGATLAAYNNDSFKAEAHERYVKVVNMLIQEIKDSKEGCDDHIFISVQLLQTLCLRDKNIALNATKSASHLSAAYEIIKKRYLLKQSNGSLQVTPLDRVLTEHFLTNFPITIILCRHDKLVQSVPSPFQFFEQFGSILSKPFNEINDDPWLNHPILGLSLKAYELAAKCSWMYRLMKTPLRQEQLLICLELRNQTNTNLALMTTFEKDTVLTTPQRTNVLFAKSKLYACLIILKKLCHSDTTIESLQVEVKALLKELQSCKPLDPTFIHSIWALFIGGSYAMDPSDRESFKKLFLHDAQSIHSSLCLKIIKYLDFIWSNDLAVGDQSTKLREHQSLFDTNFPTFLDGVWT